MSYPKILNALTRNVLEMLEAKELNAESVRANEAASLLGKQEFVIPKLLRQSARYSLPELRKIAEDAIDLGCAFRNGELSDESADEALLVKLTKSAAKR